MYMYIDIFFLLSIYQNVSITRKGKEVIVMKMKKVLSLLLTVLMVACILTVNVVAEEPNNVSYHNITVRYVVNENPVLTVPSEKTIFKGEKFNPFDVASAKDEEDGDLTAKISVKGQYDVNAVGSYVLTYTVTDKFGGSDTKELILNVINKIEEVEDTKIEQEVKLETTAPVQKAEANFSAQSIIDSVVREDAKNNSELSEKQKDAIKNGADVNVKLVVDKSTATIEETDKIEKAIKNNNSDAQVGSFLDISLLCTVTQNNSIVEQPSKITNTSEPVTVTVTVPDTLVNVDSTVTRDYDVARLHNGKVDLLGATYDATSKKLTFSTDRFSTYAIVYTDTKVEQAPVYIPNKKKPVVNTGYGFESSVIDISEGSGSIKLKIDELEEWEEFTVTCPVDVELKSKDSDTVVKANIGFEQEVIKTGGLYELKAELDNPSAELDPGIYEGTVNISITYNEYEAKIGETYYKTLKDALKDAHNDDTVILLKDIVIKDSDLSNDYYVYSIGCTLDGNNHDILLDTSPENLRYFVYFLYGSIVNAHFDLEGNGGIAVYGDNAHFINTDLYASELHYEGNDGAFVTYAQGNIYFDTCSFDGKITGTGSPTDYGAVFVGYVFGNAELLSFVNCKNYGDITLGRPALFVGNPNLYTVRLKIENFENYGDITGTYINENYKMNYYYAVTSNCYTAFIVNDVNYGPIAEKKAVDQQIPSCMEDQLIVNSGNIVNGVPDTGLSLVQNEDGTFTVTPVDDGEGYRYVVGVGLYVGVSNGSTRFYITEELDTEKLTTTIKNLKFVDEAYVNENSELGTTTTDALGNSIFENGDDTYYVVDSGQTTNGVKSAQMIYVSAFDSQGKLVASSNLSDN